MNLFDKIKSLVGNQITGINVHTNSDGQTEIYLLTLKNENGKVKIISSPEMVSDINLINTIIDLKIPVWLSVTGRNIISRKLDKDPGERYLQTILPNAKESDFVVSVTKTTQDSVFISAIRSDQLTEIINHLRSQKLNVLGVSLGSSCIQFCYDIGLMVMNEVVIPGYKLEFENNRLKQFHSSNINVFGSLQLGELTITSERLLSFTTALHYFIKGNGFDQIFPLFVSDSEQYIFKRLNRLVALGSLGLIFILLLINFMVFSRYNARQQVLSSELAYKNSFFVRYDSLRNEITLKKNLVNQMHLTDKSRFGFYADRLAATVPDKIVLTELSINKPIGKNRPGTVIEFDRSIQLSGIANGSINLNMWVKELKKQDWIEDVEIVNYENVDNKGEFKLKVSY